MLPVFALGYSIHNDLLDRIGDLESRLSAAVAAAESHFDEAERWKDRIQELETDARRQQRDPTARPDPWTGTEGRANRDRIDQLERKVFGSSP